MKKLLALAVMILCVKEASAQELYQRKYGVETKLNFALWETDGTDMKVDAADGGTDCNIIKDEGTETTCTNDFVDEGNVYSITLSATEMQAARISVCMIDTSTKAYLDKCMLIETYGETLSAQHPDLTLKTAQTGSTSTTIVLAASESYVDDLLNNNTSVSIVSGTGAGQTRCITDWDSSDVTATVATWTTIPDNTSVYVLYPTPNCGQVSVDASTVWGYGTRTLTSGSANTDPFKN